MLPVIGRRRRVASECPRLGFGPTLCVAALVACGAGCQSFAPLQPNPTVVDGDAEYVWNTTVATLDEYFDIAYENRYDGRIETLPQVGPAIWEPWLRDAVGVRDRLEGTLQTIRRRAFVLVQPGPTGGYSIQLEIVKELEDTDAAVITDFGQAAGVGSVQPVESQVVDSSVVPAKGWILLGRDTELEARILSRLHAKLGGG